MLGSIFFLLIVAPFKTCFSGGVKKTVVQELVYYLRRKSRSSSGSTLSLSACNTFWVPSLMYSVTPKIFIPLYSNFVY